MRDTASAASPPHPAVKAFASLEYKDYRKLKKTDKSLESNWDADSPIRPNLTESPGYFGLTRYTLQQHLEVKSPSRINKQLLNLTT
jgi:hypothetical protein